MTDAAVTESPKPSRRKKLEDDGWIYDMEDAPTDGKRIMLRSEGVEGTDGKSYFQIQESYWRNTRIRHNQRWIPSGWWAISPNSQLKVPFEPVAWRALRG